MKEIINRIAELRKNIETAKLTDVIEISVELIRIESLLKAINDTHCCTEFFCEYEDLEYSSKKCKKQCSGCKWIENL